MSDKPKNFETDKFRINRLKTSEFEQNERILEQSQENLATQALAKNLSITQSVFKRIRDIGKDWEEMSLFSDFDYSNQYKNWSIEIPEFDERWIPFFDCKIMVRAGEGFDDNKSFSSINQQVNYMVERIEDFKIKLTINANVYFYSSNIDTQYYAKIILNLQHPQIGV